MGFFSIKRVYHLTVCRVASCSILSEILIIVYYGCYENRDNEIVVTLFGSCTLVVHNGGNVVSKISFIYCLEGGETKLAGFEIQHTLHLQSPKFTNSKATCKSATCK